jgi:imidazole glycerol-phosphate synthase subunit HisH
VKTVLIDYGSGNLRSAAKAFERAAQESGVATAITVSSDAADVRGADRIVLPGVGAFADCRQGLAALPGMEEALDAAVRRRGRPFLGICVGMQLMAERGREFTVTEGLGWLAGEVVAIAPRDATLKIPHMGWNELVRHAEHPVLAGLGDGTHVYFVHSYRMACAAPADVLASVDYGGEIAAVVGRDNLIGTQFHPEKSQAAGLALIANFLRWRP